MNVREAKFVLQAYRPGGRDAMDPAFADALAHARSDPALAAWLACEQAFDTAIADNVRAIQPPAGLRDAILAGARLSALNPAPWWRRQSGWLAAAAVVALLLSIFTLIRPSTGGDTLEEFAVNFVADGFFLHKRSENLSELRAWLAEHQGPLPQELPLELTRLKPLGCRLLEFRRQQISLVCFERDGREYHLFVAHMPHPRSGLPRQSGGLRFLETRGHAAATWANAVARYVLVSDASLTELQRVFL